MVFADSVIVGYIEHFVWYGERSLPKHVAADNRNMEYLRTVGVPQVSSSHLRGGLLSASRFTRTTAGHGLSDDHVQEDAFMLAVQLRDYQGRLWLERKQLDFTGSKEGNFTLYDYSQAWRADLSSPFDCVNFHISRAALNTLEEDIGTKSVGYFKIEPGADISDSVVKGITSAILPVFDGPYETNQLLLDYVGAGLIIHIASTYGGAKPLAGMVKGGLTPYQLSKATAMLDANLDGNIALSDVARETGLSLSYFSRAFKVSTGSSPYKWLSQRRIERAVDLLRNTSLSIKEIAAACGFADHAHFTRSFGEAKGVPPATWRRNDRKTHFISGRGLKIFED